MKKIILINIAAKSNYWTPVISYKSLRHKKGDISACYNVITDLISLVEVRSSVDGIEIRVLRFQHCSHTVKSLNYGPPNYEIISILNLSSCATNSIRE